jgi:predicted amidohydrolase YtcJ
MHSSFEISIRATMVLCALLTSLGARSAGESTVHAADLELIGGNIHTPSGNVSAMAVSRGVIVALGTTRAVDALRTAKTAVIDLHGATVVPGLHDVHVHPLFGGIMETRCQIAQGATLSALQNRIKTCALHLGVGQHSKDEWIIGGQWDAPALGSPPDRRQLDVASPTLPVLIDDTSGHSSWANSRALALAGVTRDTPDPPGGIIERDADGAPTGVLRESAIDLVRQKIPLPGARAVRAALEGSLRKMLSFGITSYTEASVGFVAGSERELETYAALADEGVLKQRVILCLTWAAGSEEAETAIQRRNLFARDRIRPDCIKIFLDGVPTDGHTAAMLEPYADTVAGRQDDASRYGLLLVKQDVLNAAVTRFDAMGLTVKFHAAGDAAVRAGLTAIAAARTANGFSAQMHNVGHCTFVSKEDIARARGIEATFEVSPYLWGPTPINDSITAAVGTELIRRVWPVREMIDSGALVVPGSDWSVVPSVNPWVGIETLVTREMPGGSARSFGKAEAISVAEAMDLFTANAARQERTANQLGRLEVGMLADMIVVDQDPYAVAPTRLHDTHVRMTFIGGEKVYDAALSPGAH